MAKSPSDEFVFPQDHYDSDGTLIRQGGLTKRELFAAMILSRQLSGFTKAQDAAIASVKVADILLSELEKKP